jgi:hypothetical protein
MKFEIRHKIRRLMRPDNAVQILELNRYGLMLAGHAAHEKTHHGCMRATQVSTELVRWATYIDHLTSGVPPAQACKTLVQKPANSG